jgi:hypothetical protein
MIKSRLKTGSDFLWPIDSVRNLLLKSLAVWMVISLAAFQLNAKDAFPEEQKISLVKKIASLKEILKEVEKQTEFRFFYNHEQVDVRRSSKALPLVTRSPDSRYCFSKRTRHL